MQPGDMSLDWLAEYASRHLPEMLARAMREGAQSAIERDPADNGEQRRRQPLARMATADPALDAVYCTWRSRCDDGLLPRRAHLDVARLEPAAGHLTLVHVGGSHPRDDRSRSYGTPVRIDRARVAAASHVAVAWLGAPLYEDVTRPAATGPGYGRLVLPLTEDGRHVSVLAVCTAERTRP